jgi:2-polyprenyl-3-methyl-5-hydroxy-6-metoxy-1,4-benzoquinol methylase
LIYPANVTGDVPVSEFACTTGALSLHDDIVQCQRCGMVSALATIGAEKIIENYEAVVDDSYLLEEKGRRELFSWITQTMEGYSVPGKKLLEIGSNMGVFLDVAKKAGWDASGVEPSRWAVEQGVARFGVNLRQGTIESLSPTSESPDVVVMLDVLEHLVDPLAGLRRIRELISEDGVMILSTVNLGGLHARLRGERWPWFIRSHLHYFSPESLGAMLRRAGFDMVRWEIVPRSFHVSYIAQRAGESHPELRALAESLTQITDPKVPVGWLGDITFVAARPIGVKA